MMLSVTAFSVYLASTGEKTTLVNFVPIAFINYVVLRLVVAMLAYAAPEICRAALGASGAKRD